MATLSVTYDGAQLEAALMAMPPKIKRAVKQGLANSGDKVRTRVRAALVDQTNVNSPRSISSRTRSFLSEGGMAYVIASSKKNMPIGEVPWRASKSRKSWVRWSPNEHWRLQKKTGDGGRFGPLPDEEPFGKNVFAIPWGKGRAFNRSLMAKRGPVVALDEGKTWPSGSVKWSFKPILGPAVDKELVQGQSIAAWNHGIDQLVVPEILKRLAGVVL